MLTEKIRKEIREEANIHASYFEDDRKNDARQSYTEGAIVWYHKAISDNQSITELQNKIKSLEEWKRQELDLWSPVLAFAQNNELPGLQVGASISKYILELLKREHFAASLKA